MNLPKISDWWSSQVETYGVGIEEARGSFRGHCTGFHSDEEAGRRNEGYQWYI